MSSLKVTPFYVDGADDPINKQLQEPLPKVPFRMIMSASSGSGKSQLILNMILKFYQSSKQSIFDHIFIFSPSLAIDNTWKVFKQEPYFSNYITSGILQFSDELDEDFINLLINSNDHLRKLVVIDDFAADIKKDKILQNLFFRSRHNNISLIVTSQYYRTIPKSMRENASDIVCFEFGNDKEKKLVFEELSTNGMTMNDFDYICEQVFKEKYQFLYKKVKDREFYKNFEDLLWG